MDFSSDLIPVTPQDQINQYVLPSDSVGIWFTQAHSCQRDLILTARHAIEQGLFPQHPHVHLVASHREIRPEITGVADIALQEPPLEERIEWVLATAQALQVKLIIAGRFGKTYLQHAQRFEAVGIGLMAGALHIDQLDQLNDKSTFTKRCLDAHLPVVPATTVYTGEQMQAAYQYWSAQGEVSVKPVHGVFASGFWHLDPNASPFDAFANSQAFKAHPQTFIQHYGNLPEPPAYLVMPFLNGLECSVDMFCQAGEMIAAVARYKHEGDYQTLHLQDQAIDYARSLACLFGCDGLVNMQARYSDQGMLYILEVNPRPSGGIANTFFSGVNVVHAALLKGLGYVVQPDQILSEDAPPVVRHVSQPIRIR